MEAWLAQASPFTTMEGYVGVFPSVAWNQSSPVWSVVIA